MVLYQAEGGGVRFWFCIITDGMRPAKLRACLDSVSSQRGVEVLDLTICISGDYERAEMSVYTGAALRVKSKVNYLGAMRNKVLEMFHDCENPVPMYAPRGTLAVCDIEGPPEVVAVVCDDDMIFRQDFCQAVEECGHGWDVLCPRIENPNGTRYWDWATCGGPMGHVLMDYGKWDDNLYITGGLCVIRHGMEVLWDPDIPINHGEDKEFSERLIKAGKKIVSWPKAVAVHDDPQLTQKGNIVERNDQSVQAAAG